jgi:hypothetical protein
MKNRTSILSDGRRLLVVVVLSSPIAFGSAWARAQVSPGTDAPAQAPGGRAPLSGPDGTAQPPLDPTRQQAEKLLGSLLRDIQSSGATLRDLTPRAERLEQSLQELKAKVDAIALPRRKTSPSSPEELKSVQFRPPREKIVEGKVHTIHILCEGDRVSVVDYEPIAEATRKLIAENRTGEIPLKVDLPGDFRAEGTVTRGESTGTKAKVFLIRKEGRLGESKEDIQHDNSAFKRALRDHGPSAHVLDFVVWPDSFGVFRESRALVWNTYGYDWTPQEAGERLELSWGMSIQATQNR